jgi:hypothetical protein
LQGDELHGPIEAPRKCVILLLLYMGVPEGMDIDPKKHIPKLVDPYLALKQELRV